MPIVIQDVQVTLEDESSDSSPPQSATASTAPDEQKLLQTLALIRQRQDRLQVD